MLLEPLTFEQLRLIVVVYTSSLVPLVLIPYLYINNKVPAWVPYIYATFFIVCALGWELWFNYGLVYGDNVDFRRAEQLSTKLPIHINWLLNSLADSGYSDLIVHKTGHGLGLDVHEDPYVMRNNNELLEEGMVITIEPGLYKKGSLGIRIEDDVVITNDGCKSLTTFPKQLRII